MGLLTTFLRTVIFWCAAQYFSRVVPGSPGRCTGIERVGDTVFVFWLVETKTNTLAVRVLGDATAYFYNAENKMTAETWTVKPWPPWVEQWGEVGRVLDLFGVHAAMDLANRLCTLEVVEADIERAEEEVRDGRA